MKPKNILVFFIATVLLLLIPLIAMQFTNEVNWSLFDFVIMGTLLFGCGLLYEFISSKGDTLAYKAGSALAVGTGLFLIWSNLAVGVIGNEGDPANLLYLVVLAIPLVGAFASRFRAYGITRALIAAAAVQAMIPFIAMAVWKLPLDSDMIKTICANTFIALLWAGSAALFRRAAGAGPEGKTAAQNAI
jgi:hypothetical protein